MPNFGIISSFFLTLSQINMAAISCERTINGYEIGPTLGSGLQGKVKYGVHTATGEQVALKIIDKKQLRARELQNLQREIMSLKVAQHDNVIGLRALDLNARYPKKDGSSKEVILIVLEMASGGELFDFMMFTGSFSEEVARTYFRQLASGLQMCHSKGVFHRDIKAENLLLDCDFNLKIADFGLSAPGSQGKLLSTECGTKGYMAPEVVAHEPYDGAASDVWSAGVVLFIMLAGFPPFQVADMSDWWFRAITNNRYQSFWDAHRRTASFSEEAMNFMSRIFCANPADRITIEEMLDDPWFTGAVLEQDVLVAELQQRQSKVVYEKQKEKEMVRRKKSEERRRKQAAEAETVFDPFAKTVVRSVASAPTSCQESLPAPLESRFRQHKSTSQHTSMYSRCPAPEVFRRVVQAMEKLGMQHKSNEETYKIKAAMRTSAGVALDMVVEIFEADESEEGHECEDGQGLLHLVQVHRRSGGALQFRQEFEKIEQELLDITCSPPPNEFVAQELAEQAQAKQPAPTRSPEGATVSDEIKLI
jgi:serine/threonine protein kinase